jgi:UDP-N-acetylmuramate--alanine ligase
MPGVHNVGNALAAIVIADELEIPIEVTRAALAGFEGVQRRFTIRGESKGVLVVDDYGHHPTEIRATLAGARTSYPSRRIVAALQPHRYTRLRDNLEGFAACLDAADIVVVTDVYAAGEAPIPGIDSKRLVELAQARMPDRLVIHEGAIAELPARLAAIAEPGDLVLTLGAGNITRAGPVLLELLDAPLPATGTER